MGIKLKNYYFSQIRHKADELGLKFKSRPYDTRTPHSFTIAVDENEILGIIKESNDPKCIYQGVSKKLADHFSEFREVYLIIIDESLSKVIVLPFSLISRTYPRTSRGTYHHLTFTIERRDGRYKLRGGSYIPDEYVDDIPNTKKVFEVVFDLKKAWNHNNKS